MSQTTYKLNNGLDIPSIGLGLWKTPEGQKAEQAVEWALRAGYRLVDTAKIYGNEHSVGIGMKNSGVPREQIFLTTKLWNEDQGYDTALQAIDESLEKLGTEYVDLYLMHWPYPGWPLGDLSLPIKRQQTWRAMEEIYQSGKAKAIGVSNYTIKHLEEMKSYAQVMPAVNQFEFHPFLYQKELLDYCVENKILVQAYSPLIHGEKLGDERITAIAEQYQKTNAQVVLRWSLQHGCLPLPKSVHKEWIESNLQVFDFELSPEHMTALDSMNEDFRIGKDPTLIP